MSKAFETDFITEAKEKNIFSTTSAKDFFTELCKYNASDIIPKFLPREEWEKLDENEEELLRECGEEKLALNLPEDLKLWEIVKIIRAVDMYTYMRRNTKKSSLRVRKIHELGRSFEKAGLYLAEYLPILEDEKKSGKEIIENIAREFYQYGLALQNKASGNDELPEEQNQKLSVEEKQKMDEWFLGKKVYQKRMEKLGENPDEEDVEEMRKHLIQVYAKALAREEGGLTGNHISRRAEIGHVKYLQNRTKNKIIEAIETPEIEMKTSIFKHGVEKLLDELREVSDKKDDDTASKTADTEAKIEQRKIYDILQIPKLKQELAKVREAGDIEEISAKELEIAKKIQAVVSSFPYKEDVYNSAKILKTQTMNCLGSVIFGGALLEEVGIKYLHAVVPSHAVTLLITSNQKVYWQDFNHNQKKWNFTEITPDIIERGSISDVIHDSSGSFTLKDWNPYSFLKEKKMTVEFSEPTKGEQATSLHSMTIAFDKPENIVEACKYGTQLNPQYNYLYGRWGEALRKLKKPDEAINVYKKAIDTIDLDLENNDRFYRNLGETLCEIGKKEEAIGIYREGIKRNPKDLNLYYVLQKLLREQERLKEMIEIYKEGIKKNPEENHFYYLLERVLRDLERPEEMIDFYKERIKLDPRDAVVYYPLGKLLREQKRTEEARKLYSDAIIYTDNEFYYYELGNVLQDDPELQKYALDAHEHSKNVPIKDLHCVVQNILTLQGKSQSEIDSYIEELHISSQKEISYERFARTLEDLDQKEEAIEAYQQAIRIDPQKANCHAELASIFLEIGKSEEAREVLQQAIDLSEEPGNYFMMAEVLRKLAKTDDAIEAYKKAVSLEPDFFTYSIFLASTLEAQGRTEEAKQEYQRLIKVLENKEHDIEEGIITAFLADFLRRVGKPEEAIEYYQKAIQLDPDTETTVYYYGLGNTLQDIGKTEEALEFYQKTTALDKEEIEFYIFNILVQQGKSVDEINSYIKKSKFSSKTKVSYSELGELFEELGRPKEAIEAYQQAIRVNPDQNLIYRQIRNILRELGRLEEVVGMYKQAISVNPKKITLYSDLGETLHELGRPEEAVEIYKQAINVEPKALYIYNDWGESLWKEGKTEEAVEVYKQAISVDSKNDYDFYLGLGSTLCELGRTEEAVEAYKQAISVDPKEQRNWLYHCELGTVLRKMGKGKEAIKEYQKAKNIAPEDIFPSLLLGITLKEQGSLEEAQKEYMQILNIFSKEIEEEAENTDLTMTYTMVGNLLQELGKKEEAIEVYKKALNWNSKNDFPYYELGNTLQDLGRKEESMEAYKKTMYPEKEGFSSRFLMIFLSQGELMKKTFIDMEKIIKASEKDNSYYKLGKLLQEFNSPEESMKAYQQAIRINPKEMESYYELGKILEDLERKDEAMAVYKKALENNLNKNLLTNDTEEKES